MSQIETTSGRATADDTGTPPAVQAPVPLADAATPTAQLPDGEQRAHMIAEAAYYLALQRGFQNGDPQEDWLAAEREIDQRLTTTH